MKWWSRRHSQWTKNIRFTLLTFCSKENKKKISDLLYCVEKAKKPNDKQICNDLSASVEAYFLLLLPLALHIFTRERGRDEKQKVRWELLLSVVPKRVDVISKCVVVGNLGICRIKNVWREKKSSGQWYCYSWCTYFLLFESLKNN